MARSRKDPRLVLLTDARLTPESRVIGLWVAFKGAGQHELSAPEFGAVLGFDVSEKRVRAALRQLAEFGYLERSPGGRGHSDLFAFSLPASEGNLNDVENSDRVPDLGFHLGNLNGNSLPAEGTLNPDRVPVQGSLNADSLPSRESARDHERTHAVFVVSSHEETRGKDVGGDGAGAQARISPQAETALSTHSELLRGCRDSLRDYLANRVQSKRQSSYVHAIAGWLNGLDENVWSRPDGSKLEPEKRTAMLANALNDLAASDESQLKRPVGDPANLRTKINILLKPVRAFNGAASGAQRATPQSFDYSKPTTEFRGFTK